MCIVICVVFCFLFFFFFKQKTAYEMRISDWSSDVCSSDLLTAFRLGIPVFIVPFIMVYHPAMILEGSTLEIIRVAMTGLIGAGALAAGLEGYLLRQMTLIERGAALIGGLLLIRGDTTTDAIVSAEERRVGKEGGRQCRSR